MSTKKILPLVVLSVLLVAIVSIVVWSPLLFSTQTAYQQAFPKKKVNFQIDQNFSNAAMAVFTEEGDNFIRNNLLIPVAKARGVYFEDEPSTCKTEGRFNYDIISDENNIFEGKAYINQNCFNGVILKFLLDKEDQSIKVAEIDRNPEVSMANIERISPDTLLEDYLKKQNFTDSEEIKITTSFDLYGTRKLIFNRKGDSLMAKELIYPLLQKLGLADNKAEMYSRCVSGVFYEVDDTDYSVTVEDNNFYNYYYGNITIKLGCSLPKKIKFEMAKDGSSLKVFDLETKKYIPAQEWLDSKAQQFIDSNNEDAKIMNEPF